LSEKVFGTEDKSNSQMKDLGIKDAQGWWAWGGWARRRGIGVHKLLI